MDIFKSLDKAKGSMVSAIHNLVESKKLSDEQAIEYLGTLQKQYPSLKEVLQQEVYCIQNKIRQEQEALNQENEALQNDSVAPTSNEEKTPKDSFKPTIAVYGLLNAGKSYLLNMLSDNIEHEFFKCSDARETVALKTFETPSYIYLDTPGLDANNDDDLTAYQGRDQADILLFVHQASSELDQLEVDFLKDAQNKLGSSMEQSVILVISKIDNLENEQDLDTLSSKVVNQWESLLGYRPKAFNVSGKRFYAGYLNNKPVLMNKSGINELKAHIQQVCNSVDFDALKAARNNIDMAEVIEQVKSERTNIVKAYNSFVDYFQKEMEHESKYGIEQAEAHLKESIVARSECDNYFWNKQQYEYYRQELRDF